KSLARVMYSFACFFQAEDGIRDATVTGVQTCALPISATTQSAVNRQEIEYTPGASRTNSLAMITDRVPGAYMVHDQLHIRGGHRSEERRVGKECRSRWRVHH